MKKINKVDKIKKNEIDISDKEKKEILFSAIFLIVLCLIVFLPSLKNDFTNWDDTILLTENEKIRTLNFRAIKGFFTEFHYGLYHPLVSLSYAIEYKFFKYNPEIYHAVNLLFHVFNCLLVFYLIYNLGKNILSAFIGSVLFAIHPLHVESVVWIAERKDVLYAFFFILSLIFYIKYLSCENKKYLYFSLFSFVLSIFSKPMAVTLPFVLLIIDFYLKKKIDIKNKLLFFILCILFSFFTVSAQQKLGNISQTNYLINVLNASNGVIFYLIKTFIPYKLSCLYPPLDKIGGIFNYIYYISPFIVAGLLVLSYIMRQKKPEVFSGFLFFLITLLPVLHIIPAGYGVPADRNTYVPLIGVFFIIGENFSLLYNGVKSTAKIFLFLLFIFTVLVLSSISVKRVGVWKNSITLWNDAVKNYPNSPAPAYNNRADAYSKAGDIDKAIENYTKAIEIDSNFTDAYFNRGNAYQIKKEFLKAIEDYNSAIKINPKDAKIYLNRANAFAQAGDRKSAISDLDKAIQINPSFSQAFYNRGLYKLEENKIEEAIKDLNMAVNISPDFSKAYYKLSDIYGKMGNFDMALLNIEKAIKYEPQNYDYIYIRAVAYYMKKEYNKAVIDLKKLEKVNYRIPPQLMQLIKEKQ